jgi:hypothetical protein
MFQQFIKPAASVIEHVEQCRTAEEDSSQLFHQPRVLRLLQAWKAGPTTILVSSSSSAVTETEVRHVTFYASCVLCSSNICLLTKALHMQLLLWYYALPELIRTLLFSLLSSVLASDSAKKLCKHHASESVVCCL